MEKNTILKVIEKHNGNISKAAKELGITEQPCTEDLANMKFKKFE